MFLKAATLENSTHMNSLKKNNLPIFLRPALLLLILYVDDILDGGLGVHPQLVVGPAHSQCISIDHLLGSVALPVRHGG